MPDWRAMFSPKEWNKNVKFSGDVHEKLLIEGNIGTLKNFMIHYTYKGLFHLIQKKDSYAWFQAHTAVKKGKKATFLHLVFKTSIILSFLCLIQYFFCLVLKINGGLVLQSISWHLGCTTYNFLCLPQYILFVSPSTLKYMDVMIHKLLFFFISSFSKTLIILGLFLSSVHKIMIFLYL